MKNSVRYAALAATIAAGGAAFAAQAGRDHAEDDGHRGGRMHHGPGQLFEKADTDGNGTITRAELDAAQAAHLKDIDRDGNGAVTVEEMDAQHREERLARMSEHLKRLDADKNGVVTTAEFAAGHRKHVEKLDANGDGQITREELAERKHRRRGDRS